MSSIFAYVGSRTTRERNARGEGLSVYRIDPGRAAWTRLQVLGDLINPSFLAFDRTKRFLYAVHGDLSEITSFRIDRATGLLMQLNRQSTQGKNPVHLSVDPSNRFMVVANHITSSVVVLPLLEDGRLGEVIDLHQLSGKLGPHRVEQACAKPHQVEFDRTGRFIAVPDKGLDKTFVFRMSDQGKLEQVSECAGRDGSGPRHIGFAPCDRFAWIINELDSTVTSCRFDARSGRLEPFQSQSSLPDSFVGNSRASEVVVSQDGRFVYASNRGHDSVVTFSIQPESGLLSPIGWTSSSGETPRFMMQPPDADTLLVANEESDAIMAFTMDPNTELPVLSGVVARTGSPVCILLSC